MKRIILITLTTLWAGCASADLVRFDGAIGPYEIEAELQRQDDAVTGRYRYTGRDAWLDLTGESFAQDALRLQENVGNDVTGTLYLNVGDGELVGFWAHEDTDFAAQLTPTTGDVAALFAPDLPIDVSDSLTGQYSTGGYWVNDWFAPNYEIGFNGGTVNVLQLSPDQIFVGFEFIVGPTYHFAFFRGRATQAKDGIFVHDAVGPYGDDRCRLVFHFDPNGLTIEDENNGSACGFGARAHANFSLIKTNDTAEFDGSW